MNWTHLLAFQLEDVEVTVADHVVKVIKPNFAASWEEVGEENELEDTYALGTMKTLEGGYTISLKLVRMFHSFKLYFNGTEHSVFHWSEDFASICSI